MSPDNADKILLVDVNPDDAGLAVRAFEKCNWSNQLFQVRDDEEAQKFIFDAETAAFSESDTALPGNAEKSMA